jgi:adenosylcobinamide-phosphate synthase
MRRRADVLLLALALDWLAGEPPNALHPVVWLGNLIGWLERRAPRNHPPAEVLYGAGMTAACVGAAVAPVLLIERTHGQKQTTTRSHPSPAWCALRAIEAALLKTMFSWRTLHEAGERVHQPLAAGNLDGARAGLRWLVSRDTTELDAPLLAAAAIESLAENASDSVVAPLLAYALADLPGVCAYRAVNTLDAMVGYRGRYEYLGKVPARLDDLLNIAPARLTGLLIVVAAGLCDADARQAWRAMWRDHAATDSPNAGYPMAAIAGALGVRLEKAGHYCLNAGGRAPTADDLHRASWVVGAAVVLAVGTGWLGIRERVRRGAT